MNAAKGFNERLGIDGIIMTKMDGDSRGGAALSAKKVTGKPVKFIGMGEKLDALAEFLPFEASFTLDNEPMNHPDIASIIRKAKTTRYIENYHHGMTSGIALMRRKDRHAVMQAYLDCG